MGSSAGDSPEPVVGCGAGCPEDTTCTGSWVGALSLIFSISGEKSFHSSPGIAVQKAAGMGKVKEFSPTSVVSLELIIFFLLRDRVGGAAVIGGGKEHL